MKYFDTYVSNTIAGSGSQTVFFSDNLPHTGRVFYRVTQGGKFNYSFLFTNIIDSTFSDGSVTRKNYVVDTWNILSARVAVCRELDFEKVCAPAKEKDENPSVTMGCFPSENRDHIIVSSFREITFNGSIEKEVGPAEFFATDPLELELAAGEYVCLEITYRGNVIPHHAESIVPVFVKTGNRWEYSKLMPFPAMIGIDRKVPKKICYIGDSITQGCGTAVNSYTHWNAVLTENLPRENAYWNHAYGYARASDAASNGAWLFKAKQNDYAVVCYGVNDLYHEYVAEKATVVKNICAHLAEIVDKLRAANTKVLIQTVPPFDYPDEIAGMWREINAYIRNELSQKADAFFDNVPVLSENGDPDCPKARYGGHPDARGCKAWADALKDTMLEFISK